MDIKPASPGVGIDPGNWHWLALSIALAAGCTTRPEGAIEEEPPPAIDANFERLADVLSGIAGAGEVLLYEGLPSEFWEPELRQKELRDGETIQIHGHTVYDEAQRLPAEDARPVTALFSAKESFAAYRGRKACGGFQPEFCLQWQAGDSATEALISLECGEVKLYGPRGELYCDLVPAAVQRLKPLLEQYKVHAPLADSGE